MIVDIYIIEMIIIRIIHTLIRKKADFILEL